MQEPTRLAYLSAMGVTGWVPRSALPNAAFRLPPEFPEEELAVAAEPERRKESLSAKPEITQPIGDKPAPSRPKIVVPPPASRKALSSPIVTEQAVVVEPPVAAVALPPFYLQLWMAGPCAILVETHEPGLESASPGFRLLRDILRAVGLPQTPHLYADFHWPLSRNPQFDRSATAASLALQAFMQARLENEQIVSIGCFGLHTALLVGSELDSVDSIVGREEAIEQLPPAWFAPELEMLMKAPQEKARLWQQLKRIMRRWQEIQ